VKKVVEDFVCMICGEKNKGQGTTDHCFACLWGRHVDYLEPGDRLSPCKGTMKPIRSQYLKGKIRISYKCQECSHRFVVDSSNRDNRELLLELMRE
jgi:DNA-directed RNA polymerase subunit RPC12/RpoP